MQMAYPPPKRNPDSGSWRFRKVVPLALREQVGKKEIIRWLGTDAAQARKRNADLHREWEEHFASLSTGITSLTRKQALALAGKWYRWFVARFEDEPGDDPAGWFLTLDALEAVAQAGTPADAADDEPRGRGTQKRVAAFLHDRGHVAQFLANESLTLEPASLAAFMEAMETEFYAAHRRLAANAGGDFSEDTRPKRFPQWTAPTPLTAPEKPVESRDKLPLPALFEKWKAGNPQASPGTIKVYAPKVVACDAFLKGKDARDITEDDLWRWTEHRRDVEKLSPKTIRDNDIAALKSIMGWATTRDGGRLLASNPAALVKLKAVRQKTDREKTFRESEIKAILKAALEVPDDPKNPTLAYARRWVPWLCAYTGARVREMTQLRGSDIYKEGDVWVLSITPEAGTVKNGNSRRAFLHQHLVDLGFLEFAKAQGSGPLFYDPSRRRNENAKTSQAEVQAIHLAHWVRSTVNLDARVNPNHAWRHTFKTRLLEAGVDSSTRDILVGHTVFGVARAYEHASAAHFAAEVNRAPRYKLD